MKGWISAILFLLLIFLPVPRGQAEVSVEDPYFPLLSNMYDLLLQLDHAELDGIWAEEYIGMWELSRGKTQDEILQSISYRMMDLSGDGVPELIISGPDHMILNLYTLVADKPELVFSGHYRNAYYWLGKNRILHLGSASARVSILMVEKLSKDGRDSKVQELIFTDLDNRGEPATFRNTTGTLDTHLSKQIGVGLEPYQKKENSLLKQRQVFLAEPFIHFAKG